MNSANSMLTLQMAAAQFQRGAYDAALKDAETVLAGSPGHPEALHLAALSLGKLGRVDEALPLFDRAAAAHPQKHVILANKGNALRGAGRVAESIPVYEASIAAAPGYIAGWISLGLAHWRAGDAKTAEKVLRDALARAPEDPNVLNNLGVLLEEQGRSADAADMFTRALERQPNMLFALVNRGAALRKIGRLDEALSDLGKAAAAAPGDAETQYQYGNALRQAGTTDAAEQAFLRALSIAPARIDIHRDLARMLWEAGRGAGSLVRLDDAITAAPTLDLLSLKSELALLAGLFDDAEQAALRAIESYPSAPAARRTLGLVRRQRGDFGGAVEALEAALAGAPEDFETRHALAETQLASGDHQQAVRLLDKTPPPSHLQKHIALSANAMRLAGDPSYRRFYDYDRLTKKMFIETPAGYRDLAAFNDALVEAILPLHRGTTRPLEQTLFGGTQSVGRLWEEPIPVIRALKEQLLAAARQYVEELPDDADHPFLARKTTDLACAGAWSVVLASGGGHVDHIHPKGWISASYYVRIPKEVLSAEKSGFLRLGASGVKGVGLEAEKWFKPEEGSVIFFPSYMWHGVEPFDAQTPRITAPFDLAPAKEPR